MSTAAHMQESGGRSNDHTPPRQRESSMPFDMTAVLFVADQDKYAQYRAEIAPLLQATGGAFRYDLEVAKALKSEVGHDINRLFLLRFPDRGAKEWFFTHSQYLEIRARLFDAPVRRLPIIPDHAA